MRVMFSRKMQRFLAAHQGMSGCWEFDTWRDKDGYCRTKVNGKQVRAHRVAFVMTNGPVADGVNVLHSCDNPPCCRPDHLFAGSQKDNAADCMAKGRFVRGEKNGVAKLTEDQVRAIRADKRRQFDIAADYGIDQTTVSTIKTRRHWGHVR